MNVCISANEEAKCLSDREKARLDNFKGKYGPFKGPGACGEVVWMCEGVSCKTETEYKQTSCGKEPPKPPPKCKQYLAGLAGSIGCGNYKNNHGACTSYNLCVEGKY